MAERAGVNPALVHYHFGSMSALVMQAAEDALVRELGPSIQAWQSGTTIGGSVRAILKWIERDGERTPGSTILAEAMVKATRDPTFRRWTKHASRRFRSLILEWLEAARAKGELDPELDLVGSGRRSTTDPGTRPRCWRPCPWWRSALRRPTTKPAFMTALGVRMTRPMVVHPGGRQERAGRCTAHRGAEHGPHRRPAERVRLPPPRARRPEPPSSFA